MKILFATDGSEYSRGAANFLTRLTFSSTDEITVFHAIAPGPVTDEIEAFYAGFRREAAPKILDSAASILRPLNVTIRTKTAEEEPEKSIVREAKESNADLIVMGARGSKGIKMLILGSVSRSVAINSPKPVLVIRPAQFAAPEKMKILFATDGSDYADAAGKLLASLPFRDDSEITVVNVLWSTFADLPERFFVEIEGKVKEDVLKARSEEFTESEKMIKHAQEFLSKRFSDVKGLTKIGDPSTEILTAAETLKPDIIVVGCSGLTGIKGMLGSVSRNILRHSNCSVLIGKK